MKRILLFSSVLLFSLSMSTQLRAQSPLESFDVLNRVLLIKYLDSADEAAKDEALKLFKGFRKKIDGLEWVHIVELSKSTQGFDQAITLTFKLKEGVEALENHPDYLRIKEIFSRIAPKIEHYEYWEEM